MAKMMRLADKDIKTTVLSFFYRSKKMDRSEIMIKWKKIKKRMEFWKQYKLNRNDNILHKCNLFFRLLQELFKYN